MSSPSSGPQRSPGHSRGRVVLAVVAVVVTVALVIGTIAVITRAHDDTAGPAAPVVPTKTVTSKTTPRSPAPSPTVHTPGAALLILYIESANGGCESRGGTVLTKAPKIVWQHEETEPHRDGTIGGIRFAADLDSHGEWHVDLSAC